MKMLEYDEAMLCFLDGGRFAMTAKEGVHFLRSRGISRAA